VLMTTPPTMVVDAEGPWMRSDAGAKTTRSSCRRRAEATAPSGRCQQDFAKGPRRWAAQG